MSYIPHSDDDRARMLKALGIQKIDDLLSEVPMPLRYNGKLNLPPPISQLELEAVLDSFGEETGTGASLEAFLGGGLYEHYVPAMVGATLARPEFYSAYTPYQAEVSQGTLQATFEFQSLLCDLTAMPLANASLYDGATALVEAVWMAVSAGKGRDEVIIPAGLNPRYRAVLFSHLGEGPLTVREVPLDSKGLYDQDQLAELLSDRTAAVIAQNPNYMGHLEDTGAIAEAAHGAGALFLQVFEPISLALITTPGEADADIAVGEGQTLGSAVGFGGPLIGLFTCKEQFLRKMPGRLSGMTEDLDGQRAFTLTLQTREQHIRRGRATSNICTNQQLMSVAALVYLSSLGREGLRKAALLSQERALLLRKGLLEAGARLPYRETPFFREFAVEIPDRLVERLLESGIVAGIPLGKHYPDLGCSRLVAVTEMRPVESISLFARLTAEYIMENPEERHAESTAL